MTTHAPSRPQLDTTPLTGRIDRDDLHRFRREFTARFPVLVSPLFVLGRIALGILAVLAIPLGGVLLLTGGLGAIVAEDPETRGDALGMTVFAIPLFGAGVFFAWRLIRTRRRRSEIRSHYRLARFGRINGLSYTPGPVSDGHMGAAARGMILTRVMRPRTARPVEFGNHELSRGSKASGITQYGGYAMIGLRRELPHIQVISNRTRLRRSLTPTDDVARSQRLELEGDFDRHAALYCPDGYERDALYLFTPDVMDVLVDRVRGFDVEIPRRSPTAAFAGRQCDAGSRPLARRDRRDRRPDGEGRPLGALARRPAAVARGRGAFGAHCVRRGARRAGAREGPASGSPPARRGGRGSPAPDAADARAPAAHRARRGLPRPRLPDHHAAVSRSRALTRARLDTDPLTDRIRRRDLRAFRREFRREHRGG